MERGNSADGPVKVLACDVFGTVVDWHTSVTEEVRSLGLGVDAGEFALAWRAGYQPAMERVTRGEQEWALLDDLHRRILDEILDDLGVHSLDEADKVRLNRVWHRLRAWPDAVAGLTRLRDQHMLCTLSNGNIGLLAEMAKSAGLPWDCILSAETFGHYKPARQTYLGVANVFDVPPSEVMMVAAHREDLAAARSCGLRTAYVERPREFGPNVAKDVTPDPDDTVHARDLEDLATILGC